MDTKQEFQSEEGNALDESLQEILDLKPENVYLHLPSTSWLAYQYLETRFVLCKFFGINVNYFGIRHRLGTGGKRLFDLIYIHHISLDHLEAKLPLSILENIRFRWLIFIGYGKEIASFDKFYVQKTRKKNLNKFKNIYADTYYASYWQYKDDAFGDILH